MSKRKLSLKAPSRPKPTAPRPSGDEYNDYRDVVKFLAVIIFTGVVLSLIFTIALSFER